MNLTPEEKEILHKLLSDAYHNNKGKYWKYSEDELLISIKNKANINKEL